MLPPRLESETAGYERIRRALAEGVLFERRTFHATFAFEDRKEGMAAFAEKRPARFQHR